MGPDLPLGEEVSFCCLIEIHPAARMWGVGP